MADNRTQTVTIDVISDVMCPWCFIGKRRLERAAAMVEGAFSLAVAWHPFQLDASLPPEGLDRRAYLEAKFGGAEQARKAYDQIAEVGRGEGIAFDLDAIMVSPNTLDAHRVIRWAGQDGPATQDAVVEALFVRFFTRAEHIGRHAVLADAAEAAGMDGAAVRAML
uniref:DsbA family oxidoreductase n=2 Tax=Roseitalea TaxID=1915401 RepID=UPI00273EED78